MFHILSVDEYTNGGWRPRVASADLSPFIEESQSISWQAIVPSTNTSYRIRLTCTEASRGISALRDSLLELLDRLLGQGVGRPLSGRTYEVTSTHEEH